MNTPLPSSIGRPATNALKAVDVTCLEQLQKLSEKDLARLHGVGPKATAILMQALKDNNLVG